MPQIESHEIQVLDKGIHCPGCEARIQSVLAKLSGVQQVKAAHKTQLVRLTLDVEKTSLAQVKAKLEDLGYRTASTSPVEKTS